MSSETIPVAIAVVEHNGCYLVGERTEHQTLAGTSEFPGGKCRPEESPRDCAIRECREETGLEIHADTELYAITHTYDHATVDLHFWLCRPRNKKTVRAGHRGFVWVPAAQLAELRFPEANEPVLEILTRQKGRS